jgi:hypothetical protein
MRADLLVTLVCLLALAGAHSLLGERKLIGPLSRAALPPLPLPAAFAKGTLRFAWHLTSVAWLGLAACLWFWPECACAVSLTLLLSGVIALVGGKGAHFAWALFIVGGLSGMHSFATIATPVWLAVVGAAAASAIAVLHVSWASGVKWGLDAAIPQRDGKALFAPGRFGALAVAAALLVLALVFLALAGIVHLPGARVLAWLAAGVFTLRTIGDFRYVGLFRRVAGSAFARNDSRYYTPLCFGFAAALVWLV